MSRSRWLTGAGLALLTSTAAAGTFAAPAQAAGTGVVSVTTSVHGSKVIFKAGSNKTNKIVITSSGRTVTIDDVVAVKPGKGCRRSTRPRCAAPPAPPRSGSPFISARRTTW
jgi:hypothetical protein